MAAILTLIPNLLRIRVEPSENTYYIEFYNSGSATWEVIEQILMGEQTSRIKRIASLQIPTFTDGDTTPSVANSNIFKEANTSATSITTFDDGKEGQIITVIFTSDDGTGKSYTTIVHGSGIYLRGGADVTPNTNTTMSFVYDGTNWYEI